MMRFRPGGTDHKAQPSRPCIIIIDATEIATRLTIKEVLSTMDHQTRYNPYDATYDSNDKLWTVGYARPLSDSAALEGACRVYDTHGSEVMAHPASSLLSWWQSSPNASSFDMYAIGKLRKRWFEERNKMNKRKKNSAHQNSALVNGSSSLNDGGSKPSEKKPKRQKDAKDGGGEMSRPPYARHRK